LYFVENMQDKALSCTRDALPNKCIMPSFEICNNNIENSENQCEGEELNEKKKKYIYIFFFFIFVCIQRSFIYVNKNKIYI